MIQRRKTATLRRERAMRKPAVSHDFQDEVWYATQALVTEIPDCEVRTWMDGDALCVQIRIARRFERLNILEYELVRTPEEHIHMQVLHFLRGSRIVKEYRYKRDRLPELP
jgi:hypothetical protein